MTQPPNQPVYLSRYLLCACGTKATHTLYDDANKQVVLSVLCDACADEYCRTHLPIVGPV